MSKITFSIICSLLLCSFGTYAQKEEMIRPEHYNHKNGIAINGFDPVSYFDNKPQEGKKDILIKYMGINYHFASLENKTKFAKDPNKYEPVYGGWCAYAMGINGSKVEINPETYKIKNGKLYLFYNQAQNNTLPKWNKNEALLEEKANQFWDEVISH